MKNNNSPVRATGPAFRVPDDKRDRSLVIKETKRGLIEMLDGSYTHSIGSPADLPQASNPPSGPIDSLIDLAEALKKANAKIRRRR